MIFLETKDIIKWWNFPRATIINRNLPKALTYSHIKNQAEKHYLQDNVKSIYVLANFKTANTNIPQFENDNEQYQEVQFLYVRAKREIDLKKNYKVLLDLIPYPLVILTEEPNGYTICTGKFEKLSNGFLKLLKIYPSQVYNIKNLQFALQEFSLNNLPNQNFKTFYNGLSDEIATSLARKQYGEKISNLTREEKDELDDLKKQIKNLKVQIKREHQLNRKVDMQMRKKQLEDQFSDKLSKLTYFE